VSQPPQAAPPDARGPALLDVDAAFAGARLDAWLAERLELTRGYARRLLARGSVRIGRAPAKKGMLLRGGEQIEVAAFRHPREGPAPDPGGELVELVCSDGLVAIDKPAGLPSCPLDYDESRTALGAVLARYPEMSGVGDGGLMSGAVHRLDTGTSGVLLFATTDAAWQRARADFRERRADKRYTALVHGRLEARDRTIELRLEARGERVRVVESGGREAVTLILAAEPRGDDTRVELGLTTGVMHQLRATLAALGHPVVGDRIYGSEVKLDRHLLHAHSLALPGLRAESPVPPELR